MSWDWADQCKEMHKQHINLENHFLLCFLCYSLDVTYRMNNGPELKQYFSFCLMKNSVCHSLNISIASVAKSNCLLLWTIGVKVSFQVCKPFHFLASSYCTSFDFQLYFTASIALQQEFINSWSCCFCFARIHQQRLQELDEECKTHTIPCFFANTTSNAHFRIGTRVGVWH